MAFARAALKKNLFLAAQEIDKKALQRRAKAPEVAKHKIAYSDARRKVADYVLGVSDFAKNPIERKLLTKLFLSPYFHVANTFAEKNMLNQLDRRKVRRLASILIHLKEESRGKLGNDFVSNAAAHCLGNLMVLEAVSKHPRLVREQKRRAASDEYLSKRNAIEGEKLDRQSLALSASKAWLEQGASDRVLSTLMSDATIKKLSLEEVNFCRKAIEGRDFVSLKEILQKHSLL
ncbi:MAG: hypothetical protein WC746_02130 [archaeon]|jgi:hypothetical protein